MYKMNYYDEVIQRRRAIAQKYHDVLSFEGVRLPPAPNKGKGILTCSKLRILHQVER